MYACAFAKSSTARISAHFKYMQHFLPTVRRSYRQLSDEFGIKSGNFVCFVLINFLFFSNFCRGSLVNSAPSAYLIVHQAWIIARHAHSRCVDEHETRRYVFSAKRKRLMLRSSIRSISSLNLFYANWVQFNTSKHKYTNSIRDTHDRFI